MVLLITSHFRFLHAIFPRTSRLQQRCVHYFETTLVISSLFRIQKFIRSPLHKDENDIRATVLSSPYVGHQFFQPSTTRTTFHSALREWSCRELRTMAAYFLPFWSPIAVDAYPAVWLRLLTVVLLAGSHFTFAPSTLVYATVLCIREIFTTIFVYLLVRTKIRTLVNF